MGMAAMKKMKNKDLGKRCREKGEKLHKKQGEMKNCIFLGYDLLQFPRNA